VGTTSVLLFYVLCFVDLYCFTTETVSTTLLVTLTPKLGCYVLVEFSLQNISYPHLKLHQHLAPFSASLPTNQKMVENMLNPKPPVCPYLRLCVCPCVRVLFFRARATNDQTEVEVKSDWSTIL
jgi:hypothetical protein